VTGATPEPAPPRTRAGTVARVRHPRAPTLLALAATAPALGGCGFGASSYANRDRPPSPVMLSAAIDHSQVRVTPGKVGAGPVQVVVANLTGDAQRLTFETAGRGNGIRTTATVGPKDTVEMQVNPRPGSYQLSVRGHAIRAASLKVGPQRASAQNALLEP
jgi:hypothetical protein